MSGRNSQISRLYRILTILEGAPQGLTTTELWRRVEERGHSVHKRTVYRDLEALEGAGFPLSHVGDDEHSARWALTQRTRVTQHLVLSARELLALYLSRAALTPLKETPFYEDLQSVFSKIEEKLGGNHRDYLKQLSAELFFEPGPQWGLGLRPEVVDAVHAACGEKQVLEVEYRSMNVNSPRKRKLGPHFLYFSKGSLYLVAEDLADRQVKTFALPRMSHAEMRDEAYTGEVTDPEHFFKDSFGIFRGTEPVHVRLHVSSDRAAFVKERRWHASQKVVSKTDDALELTFDISLTPEFVQWVLSFGPSMTVLAPESLKASVIEAAQATLDLYSKKAA